MNSLLSFFLQSVGCSLVFYVIYYLVLRNERSHTFNRYYLLLSALFSLIFPLIRIDSPFTLGDEVAAVVNLPGLIIGDSDPYSSSYTGFSWLTVVYGLGLLFFTSRFLAKIFSLLRLVKACESEQLSGYILVRTGGKLPTFSFLNYLFWDDSQPLDEAQKQQILRHELAHINRRHSFDILFLETLHAIMWFNPLIYLIKNALMMTHEFEADDKATEGKNIEDYQKLLAQQVLNQYGLSLGSHFNQSQTLKRLRMLTNKNANVYWGKYVLPVLAFLFVFGVISCEHPGMETEEVSVQASAIEGEAGKEIFTEVDEMPTPPGGFESFYTYIARELKYPKQAREMGVQGKVFVEFVVDKYGEVVDVKVKSGIGAGCDQEAAGVIARSPRWAAGKVNGQEVNTQLILPITFKLDDEEGENKVVDEVKVRVNEPTEE